MFVSDLFSWVFWSGWLLIGPASFLFLNFPVLILFYRDQLLGKNGNLNLFLFVNSLEDSLLDQKKRKKGLQWLND